MNKNNIIVLSLLIISVTACNDWLDIRPENQTVLEDYWQSESQATQVLSSCYRGLITDACIDRMIVWGELRSDNITVGSGVSSDLAKILNVNITPTNAYADWGAFYSVINYCNTFLHFAPGVLDRDQNFTPSKLRTLEAEAKTLRALSYFYLVRAFKEVPLVTQPSISDDQNYSVGKNTEREVLDTIIADLKFAQKYARADYGKGAYNKGRITLSAVNALLADVYLWDQQYANCIEACDLVLNSKSYSLIPGEKVLNEVFFTGNSTESIFELQFDKTVQYNTMVDNYYGHEGNKSGALSFPLFLTRSGNFSPFNFAVSTVKESEKDIREYNSCSTVKNGYGNYDIYKYALSQNIENADGTYSPKYRSAGTTVNWILYRLSDIMLLKAEALVQQNNSFENRKQAMELVNVTYKRSNVTADSLLIGDYNDQSSMEKLVLRERQRELLFEGKRWFDLMRYVRRKQDATVILSYIAPKLSGNTMSSNKLSVMNALYMPISKYQIEINPNLFQNPFYLDENLSK